MLLSADDLAADQAYHRGRIWLHEARLHGAGTRAIIRGLVALDAIDARQCRRRVADGHRRSAVTRDLADLADETGRSPVISPARRPSRRLRRGALAVTLVAHG